MSQYFGKKVDQAIVDYQRQPDVEIKKKIFEKEIMPAFIKLSEYHYYKFPIRKNPDVINECLTYLYERINNFDTEKYQRGFPYFNFITKNYYIQRLKQENKEVSADKDFVSFSEPGNLVGDDLIVEHMESTFERKEFIELFKKNLVKWKDKFTKDQERKLAEGLIHLFENADSIDIYQKKAIFFYLKEITGLNSKQITANLNKIFKKFKVFKEKYEEGLV